MLLGAGIFVDGSVHGLDHVLPNVRSTNSTTSRSQVVMFQTLTWGNVVSDRLGLLLKFSLKWPEELKGLMRMLSVFNINL